MKFTDDSVMPWGKYQGEKMSNVPDSYLLWLWTDGQKFRANNRALFAYIEDNLDAIKSNIKNESNGRKQ